MTRIQIRTDGKLKKDAQRILAELGLDLSTAVNLFLVQIKLRKGLPFPIVTENGFTTEQEQQLIRDLRDAKRSRSRYASGKEVTRAILGA